MNPISTAALEHYDRKVARLREQVRAAQARGEGLVAEALEDYLARNRAAILRELTIVLAERAPPLPMADADLWTPARRTDANLAAMHLLATKAPTAMTTEDRLTLARYSGFGGLSIEKIKGRIPASLEVDTRELIHSYYTPTVLVQEIARATLPLLPALVGADQYIRAIEPSAGIGRFIRSFDNLPGRPMIRWTAVEYSALAASLLVAVRPGLTVFTGPFERWIREHRDSAASFNLVVANPPFGERGEAQFEDPDRDYHEKSAAAYFLRRGLDLLVPGGLGIYIIPKGFLSDPRQSELRERVFLKHHLIAAYRLPTDVRQDDGRLRPLFPGAHNVVDLLFFRRRSGELAEVDAADRNIVDGRYFDDTPGHVLGEQEGTRWLKVIGPPVRLPRILERPICQDCRLRPSIALPPAAALDTGEDPRVTSARTLARRVDNYLAALSAGRSGEDPALLWPELHGALMDWRQQFGNPYEPDNLRALAVDREVSTGMLRAFDPEGRLIPALLQAPVRVAAYRGPKGDPVALAEHLYRQERGLSVPRLMQALAEQDSALSRDAALDLLYRADWCVDGPGLQLLVPGADYMTGDLWARHDHAMAQPNHPRTSIQVQRLLAAIGPALLGDLGEYSAREGWVPLSLRAAFINEQLGQDALPITLEVENGLIQPRGIAYQDIDDPEGILNAEVIAFLGWLNHDMPVFKPKRQKGQTLLEAREEIRDAWSENFRRFVAENPAREAELLQAYNRQLRGFRPATYSEAELAIARWTKDPGKQLHDYQRAGVRRIVSNVGCILSYDVGVGKTFTALAAIALLRQEGVIRRPVVLVPNSLVFQWYAEIASVLPDYRVAIIGAKFVVRSRGERRGETDSATDTSAERAAKWARFQGGEYDLVLLTYSSMPLTRLNLENAAEFISDSSGSGRAIALKHRSLAKKKREDRTERENAIIDEGTPAWIREFTEIQEGREYDGNVVWDDLGIDFLVIDEMHNFKNLFLPEPRERGLPAFMGSGGEGSARAWQLFFRCAAIRARTGGAGILGLTATIAKNGPTELYTAISYINPRSWTQLGIGDSEQFIDQFCLLERRPVVSTSMKIEVRDAMVGFKNLSDLRSILTRFVEFRNATELARLGKFKKPKASTELVWVDMNDAQRARMLAIAQQTRDSIVAALSGEKEQDDDEKPTRPTLGMIVNMGLIAIHPQLVDGYTPDTALEGGIVDGEVLPRPDYHSPKFDAIARRIVAQSGCGHIVFIEPIVAHIWLREVLAHAGIPRERIALLNAHMAPSTASRAQIARDFNAGKYIVVIANAVAGEGANLQRQTCAVHNGDIPWDPMTRRQPNGRADRQGNEQDAIILYDYLTRRTGDGPRFDKMSGKGTWIEKIVDSDDDVAINPAADVSLSPIELLADLTDDPEEARRLLTAITAEAEREAREKLLKRIARLMRAANDRYRAAEHAKDPIEAARLRQLGQGMLEDLRKFDTSVWPFAELSERIASEPVAVPDAAIPLWNGARVWGKGGTEVERAEYGRLDDSSSVIARRWTGAARWETIAAKKLPALEYSAGAFTGPWPEDDETIRAAIAREVERLRSEKTWRPLGWMWASEAWLTRWWPEIEPALREHLGRRHKWEPLIPAVTQDDVLYLAPASNLAGTTLLPPSAAGWERYLRLAPITDYKQSELRAVARTWWDRSMPTTRAQPVVEQPTPAGRSEDESQVLREAQLRGLDAAGQEQRLEFVWRTRKYMEAAAILLRHRGHDVVFGPKLTDGFTIDLESAAPYVKSPTFAFGGPIKEPATRHLAVLSIRATADVVAAVALEKPAHGDAAIDVVLTNLRADPAHYDPPAAAPLPAEPTPAPASPPSTSASSTPRPTPSPSATAGALVVVATRHSKDNHPIWVVKKTRDLGDQEFALLRQLARDEGGYYSTYRSRTVPAGFVFKSSEAAHNFVSRFDSLSSAAPGVASPTSAITPGSHYMIGEQFYGDEALLRALRGRFPATADSGVISVAIPAGTLKLQHYADDPRLPSQDGALYSIFRSDPAVDLHSLMGTLWRDGFTVFRGTWAAWDDTPGIKAQHDAQEAAAPSDFKEQATPLHHQDPESVRVLDDMVRRLSESLTVDKLRSGQGYRVVALRSNNGDTVFDGLPPGTPLVTLTLWHPPGEANPDWNDLHAAIRRLSRPYDQSRAIRRHVLELVEQASEAARGGPTPPKAVDSPQGRGHFYRVGDLWYGDTAFVNGVGPQRHLGFGDFEATLPEGTLTFTRYSDEPRLPGQSGRLHRLNFAGQGILADLLTRLAAEGLAEDGGAWDSWPPIPAPTADT